MADEETQAGSPPVVVPNPIEQSLRDHFERILLISEEAAASLGAERACRRSGSRDLVWAVRPIASRLLLALVPLAILARVSPILVLSSGCFGYFLT